MANNPKANVKIFQRDYYKKLNIENQILTSKLFNTSNILRFRQGICNYDSK